MGHSRFVVEAQETGESVQNVWSGPTCNEVQETGGGTKVDVDIDKRVVILIGSGAEFDVWCDGSGNGSAVGKSEFQKSGLNMLGLLHSGSVFGFHYEITQYFRGWSVS